MEKSLIQIQPVKGNGRVGTVGKEVHVSLIVLAVVLTFAWSVLFNQPVERSLQNATLVALALGWTLWLHRRWALEAVISRGQWLLLMNLLFAAVALVHWHWLGEATTEYGTGISDAHYVLDAMKGVGPEYVLVYVAGYALWLYPIVTIFGAENFYAIALLNTTVLAIAALALAVVLSGVPTSSRAVPLWLFLFHPYSVVLAATIYKDPLVICGTVLVFAGLSLGFRRRGNESVRQGPSPRAFIVAGLTISLLARPAYALVLILFVGIVFFAQSVRQGRIRFQAIRNLVVLALVMAVAFFAAGYVGSLDTVLNSLARIYDSSRAANTSLATGGYVADEASLGARYLSGSLIQRLVSLPLQVAMQLVSPFPPQLSPIENVYLWVEECFGLINLTLAPFLAIGLIVAIRSRDRVIKLIPVYSLFIIMPAIAFGGVVGRQLAPIVPFLVMLAWLGWRTPSSNLTRIIVILMIPACWVVAFGSYYYLRGL